MEYSDKQIQQIVEEYKLLADSLTELERIQKDPMAVLGYYVTQYNTAQKALSFFDSEHITPGLKKELKIGELEKKFNDLANLQVQPS